MGFVSRKKSGRILNGSTLIVPDSGISTSIIENGKTFTSKDISLSVPRLNQNPSPVTLPSPTPSNSFIVSPTPSQTTPLFIGYPYILGTSVTPALGDGLSYFVDTWTGSIPPVGSASFSPDGLDKPINQLNGGFAFNVVDDDGVDRTLYFLDLMSATNSTYLIHFTQSGQTATYSGQCGSFTYEPGGSNLTIRQLGSSEGGQPFVQTLSAGTSFGAFNTFYIKYEVFGIPTPTPSSTPTPTPTPTSP